MVGMAFPSTANRSWQSMGFQSLQRGIKRFTPWNPQRDPLIGEWMSKIQAHGRQHHAILARPLEERLVPTVVTMAVVTDHWMRHVIEMPSDLMPSPRHRMDFQQGELR